MRGGHDPRPVTPWTIETCPLTSLLWLVVSVLSQLQRKQTCSLCMETPALPETPPHLRPPGFTSPCCGQQGRWRGAAQLGVVQLQAVPKRACGHLGSCQARGLGVNRPLASPNLDLNIPNS